jgi:hypothetical protein
MKFTRNLVLVAAATAMLTMSSCITNKTTYLNKYTDFVETVEADGSSHSYSKWKRLEKKFEKYSQTDLNRFKGDMTGKEIAQAGVLYTRYRAAQVKYGIQNIKDGIEVIKGIFKGQE